jgi:hypothetical protein
MRRDRELGTTGEVPVRGREAVHWGVEGSTVIEVARNIVYHAFDLKLHRS